jgi:hypothetical protein
MLHFAYKTFRTYCRFINNLVLLIILLRRRTNQQDQWILEHNPENICRSIFSWDWRWMELCFAHVQEPAWVLAPVNWVLLPENNYEVWLVTRLWAGWFDLISSRGKRLSLSQDVQASAGAKQACYAISTSSSFRVKVTVLWSWPMTCN